MKALRQLAGAGVYGLGCVAALYAVRALLKCAPQLLGIEGAELVTVYAYTCAVIWIGFFGPLAERIKKPRR